MNVVQVEAVFRKVLDTSTITIGAPVKGTPRLSDFALMGGPVHVYWKCEPRAKKGSAILFLCSSKGNKTRHCKKLPQWCHGKILSVCNSRPMVMRGPGWKQRGGVFFPDYIVRCVWLWKVIERKSYGRPEQTKRKTRGLVISYYHKVGHNLKISAWRIWNSRGEGVFSVPNKCWKQGL